MSQPAEHIRSARTASTPRFDWSDPLLLESALTEEERMVRGRRRATTRRAP